MLLPTRDAWELRVELVGALAERAALRLPLPAVGDAACEVALTLGGRRDLPLGELEALALQRAFCGVRGAPAQHTVRGPLQLGDPRPRFVSDALRLGLGVAGRMKLVGEMLGVATNALAKLLELGLQLNDGRARSRGLGGQPGARGLEAGRATLALGVDAVQGETSLRRAPAVFLLADALAYRPRAISEETSPCEARSAQSWLTAT